MLATPVGPDVLLNWFWRGKHPFLFLVLLAAGDTGQAAFIRDVFEQKENIDIVSGPDIAVFLFGGRVTRAAAVQVDASYEHLIIPGQRVGPDSRARWMDDSPIAVRVENLATETRDEIVRRSMTATNDLVRRLQLDAQALPGIVVLSQALGEEDTLFVQTHDAASVRDFIAFLRELRAVAAQLPHHDRAAAAEAAKESEAFPVEEYRTVTVGHQRAKEKLRRELAIVIDGLVAHGLPRAEADRLLNLDPDDSVALILKNLRLSWLVPTEDLSEASIRAVRSAVQENEALREAIRGVRGLLRTTHQLGNRRRKLDRVLGAIANVQDRTSRYLIEHEGRLAEIDRLASRYEARFYWSSKGKQLGKVIAGAVGLLKQGKDLEKIASLLQKTGDKAT